jgi:hypothetical protein
VTVTVTGTDVRRSEPVAVDDAAELRPERGEGFDLPRLAAEQREKRRVRRVLAELDE